MASITLLHARLLFTLLLVFGVLMIWGVVGFLRGRTVTRGYRSALAIGELLMLAQFGLGLLLLLNGQQPYRQAIHLMYGVVAIITVPGAVLYTRGRDQRWAWLIYALVCLFLCGIALRGLATGRAPGR